MNFKFSFTTFTVSLSLISIFMIAGLYTWIVFGLDVQNTQLQIIEKQNRDLNNKQLGLQNLTIQNQHTTLVNQELIRHTLNETRQDEQRAITALNDTRHNSEVLHQILADIHLHLTNITLNASQLRAFDIDNDTK